MNLPKKATILKLAKRALLAPVILSLIGLGFIGLTFFAPYYPESWQEYLVLSADFGHFLISFSMALFGYKFLIVLCKEYEKWLTTHGHRVATMIVSIVRRGLKIIFFLIAIQIIVSYLGLSADYLRIVRKSIDVFLIGSIGWIFLQILVATEMYFYQSTLQTDHPDIQKRRAIYTKIHLIKNTLTILIIIFTLAAMLMVFDSVRSIGVSILASAGFLTAILGLAAQRTLSSLFAGIQLALSQPIKINDVIIVENNRGIIEDITLSYVVVKLTNLRRMVIPINQFMEKPFYNLSRTQSNLIEVFQMYIDYMVPLAVIREQFNKILSASTYWDKQLGIMQVANVNENGVELQFVVTAADADILSNLKAEILEKLVEYIQNNHPDSFPKKRVQTDENHK